MELFEFHVYGERLFDLILVLRYIFISFIFISFFFSFLPQLYSRPLLRFTCVFIYLINCTFLTIVYWATIYTPTGIVTYNSKQPSYNVMRWQDCDDSGSVNNDTRVFIHYSCGCSYMYKDTHDTLKWYLEHLLCIYLDVNLDCWLVILYVRCMCSNESSSG